MFKKYVITALATLGFIGAAFAAEITGAGATFPYPLYSKWAEAYEKETGNRLNYQSIGSGAGVKQIQAKTVNFGATDNPLKPEDLEKHGLLQFPTVIGGVVPVVNLDGINARDLTLTGEVLANIYLGKITKWNDPAIAKLNPNFKLPDLVINVVRRADGSGTTFIFTNYLSKVSAGWKNSVGEGSAVEFPVGVGAKGNDGVSSNVKQIKGAIGYVEYAYAKQNGLAYTNLVNLAGNTVAPDKKSFQAAANLTDFDPAKGFFAILTDSKNPEAWPISGATFILLRKEVDNTEVIKFFQFGYEKGDEMAEKLDYVPLSKEVKDSVKKYLAVK